MAQQGRIKSTKQLRSRPVQSQQGGFGGSGRGQQQQKDMGAHPTYGAHERDEIERRDAMANPQGIDEVQNEKPSGGGKRSRAKR